MPTAYHRAGVDEDRARAATAGLVSILSSISLDRPKRAALGSGHYANVIELGANLGVAVSMDGVGSKAIIAEQLGDFETIGIDCIAMNVNDIVCVGAEPIAVLDYISVQDPDPAMLESIAKGLKQGAEDACVEIPGGEIAQLPDMIQGHPDRGFDLVGAGLGLVPLDRMITGSGIQPGDTIIGLPSSGVHANGLSLARKALPQLDERMTSEKTVGQVLLTPTTIYVRAVRQLLASGTEVHGLAHITSDSFRNLLRLNDQVGYRLDSVPQRPEHAIFSLIEEHAQVSSGDMWRWFNMGCGFCCIIPSRDADTAVDILRQHHPGTAIIGLVTADAGRVELLQPGLVGTVEHPFHPL